MTSTTLLESKTEDVARFTSVDRQADPGFFVEFCDAGNALPDIQSVKRGMTGQLGLRDGLSLLDVGCGTGDDVRKLAQVIGTRGRVVGVDVSGAMIAEAKRRHRNSRLSLQFLEGSAQDLLFPDSTFDRCRTERMLMHVEQPEQALREMVRVVKPGGKVVAFELDGDTVFADHPQRTTTRKVAHSLRDGIKNGWIGSSLPRLFRAAGLRDIVSVPHAVRIDCSFAHRLFDGHLKRAQGAGSISAAELATWWSYLEQAEAAGGFHAGFLGYIVAGKKPV
ncbi:MAG: methyltransferase domain-containing protein [Bryobacteraceae bacterium]